MGYYTKFDLDVISGQSDPVELERFYQDQGNDKTFGSYDLPLDLNDSEPMKWYDWKKDMEALSMDYPNVLLVLSGEGEESGDIWKSYFMNGQSQVVKAKVVFDAPDFSSFKRVSSRRNEEIKARKTELEEELIRIQSELDSLN